MGLPEYLYNLQKKYYYREDVKILVVRFPKIIQGATGDFALGTTPTTIFDVSRDFDIVEVRNDLADTALSSTSRWWGAIPDARIKVSCWEAYITGTITNSDTANDHTATLTYTAINNEISRSATINVTVPAGGSVTLAQSMGHLYFGLDNVLSKTFQLKLEAYADADAVLTLSNPSTVFGLSAATTWNPQMFIAPSLDLWILSKQQAGSGFYVSAYGSPGSIYSYFFLQDENFNYYTVQDPAISYTNAPYRNLHVPKDLVLQHKIRHTNTAGAAFTIGMFLLVKEVKT